MDDAAPAPEGLIRLTHVIYGLHAFSAVMGVVSSVAVVTAFLTGWPSILAVILNYAKRPDVRGTFLESHFRWQIRTFWGALAWTCIFGVFAFVMILTVVLIPVAVLGVMAIGIWVLYRIVRGWLALLENRPIVVD